MDIDGSSPLATIPRVWPFKRVFYGWAIVIATFVVSFGQVPVFGPVLGVFILPHTGGAGVVTGHHLPSLYHWQHDWVRHYIHHRYPS